MYRLIRLIVKYHFFLLFVFLEIISILLAVSFSKHHNSVFLSSSNGVVGNINSTFSDMSSYINLRDKNSKLLAQNTMLLNHTKESYLSSKTIFNYINDSVYTQQYKYTSANTIQNNIQNKHNYLSLNKGKKNGVISESAVICPSGIVGIVSKVSNNFCNVISVLNTDLSISAKIKKNNYFGSLNWDGMDYQHAKLKEIPFHVDLTIGDTIITSGYSLIFPENILIGTISNFSKIKGGDFYDITIKFSTDFKNINQVYIIKNLKKNEIINLQLENDK